MLLSSLGISDIEREIASYRRDLGSRQEQLKEAKDAIDVLEARINALNDVLVVFKKTNNAFCVVKVGQE